MFNKLLNSNSQNELLKNIMLFIIVVILSAFLIRYLWNKTLVPHVTILKPVNTLLDALLLSIGLNLIS